MKLEKLVLENFRQFRGRQEVTFATADDQNITLIHAENGFGKTALLNALLWGFYGHEGLSNDFPKKDKLINNIAAAVAKDPETTEAAVTILFEHEGIRYTIRRSLTLARQLSDSTKTDLRMEFMRDGQTFSERTPQAAQARIQTIMPGGISRFLFFNGERIDHLAMEESAGEITEAIHQMLGLKLLRTAVDDLRHNSVRGKLRAELRDKTSDEKKTLLDRQAEIDDAIDKLEERKATEQANLAGIAHQLAAVKDKLLANRTAHELQKRRNELAEHQSTLGDRKDAVSKRLAQLIAEDGFTIFSSGLVQRGRELVTELRSQGAIPARVLNTFIEELLAGADCICHRPLPPGSPERAAVEQLLTRAGDAHFNNAVGALDNAIGVLEGAYSRTREAIRDTNAERLRIIEELSDVSEELESIRQKLSGKDDEEVHQLEATRDSHELRERECHAEINRFEGRIQQLADERVDITSQIDKLNDVEVAAQLAQRRLDAVEHTASLLEEILQMETEELRPLLNDEIKTHFLRIIDRPYWPDLSEDFVLSIRQHIVAEDLDDPLVLEVGPSTGQRQITSLVFIASLVALAKRRANIPTILRGLGGSEYPIVMDSPFGSLSTRFREGVARWVPSLAPEVLVLVSDTQYKGPVESVLNQTQKVGRRYYLRLHGPGLHDKVDDVLVLGSHQYQRYFEAREEFTELVEIEQ